MLLGLLKNVQFARSSSTIKHHNFDNANANKSVMFNKEDKTQSFSTLRGCQCANFTSLKLIIMSASLDARGFSEYFGGAKAVHIQGRQYPVDVLYTYQPEPDYIDATLITIFQVINLHLAISSSFFLKLDHRWGPTYNQYVGLQNATRNMNLDEVSPRLVGFWRFSDIDLLIALSVIFFLKIPPPNRMKNHKRSSNWEITCFNTSLYFA